MYAFSYPFGLTLTVLSLTFVDFVIKLLILIKESTVKYSFPYLSLRFVLLYSSAVFSLNKLFGPYQFSSFSILRRFISSSATSQQHLPFANITSKSPVYFGLKAFLFFSPKLSK